MRQNVGYIENRKSVDKNLPDIRLFYKLCGKYVAKDSDNWTKDEGKLLDLFSCVYSISLVASRMRHMFFPINAGLLT